MTSSSCAISASRISILTIDRRQAARFGINVADIQDAVQTAVGGNAVSQVLIGEQRYDVVVRYQEPYRNTQQAIENSSPAFALRRAGVPGAVD
jgi:Cu/Ag efflux pump CusA